VKGATTGTTTDQGGNFSLSAPANATLVIGYVGYANQEIPVGDSSTINVTLQRQCFVKRGGGDRLSNGTETGFNRGRRCN
jgi:hypothetical protein